MEKFVVIILPDKLFLFENQNNKNFKQVYISGEKFLKIHPASYAKEFLEIRQIIIDICNYPDLHNIGFDVIYQNVDTDTLKKLSETLLPCLGWQIFNFERMLPELLFKMKKLKSESAVNVKFENNSYYATMDQTGDIKINLTNSEPDVILEIKDIPEIWFSNYEFITDEKEKKQFLSEIEKMKKHYTKIETDNNKTIKALENEILQKNEKFDELNEKCKRAMALVHKKYIVSSRNLVYANYNDKVLKTLMTNIGGSSLTFTISWKVTNGQIVKMNQELFTICSTNHFMGVPLDVTQNATQIVNSPSAGRVFILNDKSSINKNELVAIISDESDDMDSINQWLSKFPK